MNGSERSRARSGIKPRPPRRPADADAKKTEAEVASRELHRATAGDASRVYVLLEQGWDPTLRCQEYGDRVATRLHRVRRGDAFRRYRSEHAGAWDWAAARVPVRSEAEEEERAESRARGRARGEGCGALTWSGAGRSSPRARRPEAARIAAAAGDEEALIAALGDANGSAVSLATSRTSQRNWRRYQIPRTRASRA